MALTGTGVANNEVGIRGMASFAIGKLALAGPAAGCRARPAAQKPRRTQRRRIGPHRVARLRADRYSRATGHSPASWHGPFAGTIKVLVVGPSIGGLHGWLGLVTHEQP
jgi:hypothetical protein